MTELSEEDKDEIKIALQNHMSKCDDLYYELRNDLSHQYKVSVDDIERIWDGN